MSNDQYPECECGWFAMDKDGYLGVFITAGMAPIPVQVMVQNIIPVEDIETQLCELLPVVSEVIEVAPSHSDFELASRGLFVYDWTDIHHISSEKLNK